MTPGEYIQWFLTPDEMTEVTQPFQNYKDIKNNLVQNVSIKTYSDAIKKRFNQDDEAITKYMNLASNLVNNTTFQGALDQAMANFQVPEYTNQKVYALQQLFIQNANEYSKLVEQLQAALEQVISFLGVADLDALSSKEALDGLHYLFKDNNEFDRVIKENKYLKLSNAAKGQYRSLIASLASFPEIAQAKRGDATNIKIIAKLLLFIQTLSGFCIEFQIENEMNNIIDKLQREVPGIISVKTSGAERSAGETFRVNTADLSFNLSGSQGNLKFKLPNLGVSIKRTHRNLQTAKNINIRLKGTTYGALMSELDPRLVTYFYTIYANTRPEGQKALPSGSLTTAYKYMKMSVLIPALIGGINSEDLVSIFIINNQAYTILDLLQQMANKVGDNDDSIIAMKPSFKTQHKSIVEQHKSFYAKTPQGANSRSNKIRAEINKISTSITLKLSGNMFR